MLLLGLTGGIASGKSLVAGVFQDCGAQLIDADKIAHDLLEPGRQAWQDVVSHFGSTVQLPDGAVDRKKLGEIVFRDQEEREWLNRCIHPRVFEAYQTRLRQIAVRDPQAVVVLDAALLIETGYYRKMDAVIVVDAREDQQLQRLIERDGLSREQALARIWSQMPLAEKRDYADHVIENTGDREATVRRAREVFEACVRAGKRQ